MCPPTGYSVSGSANAAESFNPLSTRCVRQLIFMLFLIALLLVSIRFQRDVSANPNQYQRRELVTSVSIRFQRDVSANFEEKYLVNLGSFVSIRFQRDVSANSVVADAEYRG